MTTENQPARMGDNPRLVAARYALTMAQMQWRHDISDVVSARALDDAIEELEAAAIESARELSAHGGDGGYRAALKHIATVLGPKVPKCCQGCRWEWQEALQTATAALATQQPASGKWVPTDGEISQIFLASGVPAKIVAGEKISPSDWFDFARAVAATAPTQNQKMEGWRNAVLDHLVVTAMGAPLDEAPYKTIGRIIDWHVAVATDPKVNGGLSLQPVEALPIEGAPTVHGWYWHWDGESMEMLFVHQRPGHNYMAVQEEDFRGKRHFRMVNKMGGVWFGPLLPPASPIGAQT